MISVDTNVLVRAYLNDDEKQSQKAQTLMKNLSEKGRLFISAIAILEFVWVLKVKRFTRQQIYKAIMTLCHTPGTTIAQRPLVMSAAHLYHRGHADFGDYMIMAESQPHSVTSIASFDRDFMDDSPMVHEP